MEIKASSINARSLWALFILSGAAVAACAGALTPERTVNEIRFVLIGTADSGTPLYVELNDADGQVGWVKAFRNDEQISLNERCEIQDCSNPGPVCGMSMVMVRQIAAGGQADSLEFVWDGTTSSFDPSTGCELRESAPAGSYTAEFCYGREITQEGEGDPAVAVPGSLVNSTCHVVPFGFPADGRVVFTVPAG